VYSCKKYEGKEVVIWMDIYSKLIDATTVKLQIRGPAKWWAKKLKITPPTLTGWKRNKSIPLWYRERILNVCRQQGIDFTAKDWRV
jgi:hypothetical protein